MMIEFIRIRVAVWNHLNRAAAAVLLLCACGLSCPADADPALPGGASFITTVEGISEYRLANGLKVLLFPDASKPTLTVNITYLVGSRHENYGETGMAHLLEHMVFKGTPAHPNISKELEQRGARPNGSTWLDRTNYYELLPATDDNLQWAIALEADRMVNSFIARKDLDSEMTVVRNEFEMGENRPQSVLLKRLQSIAYDWHSYGRSTIGNRSDIENVRIENLQAFYRTYYQPDNAVLVIAGKFDPAKALQYVADSFGKLAKPQRELPPLWTVEPTQDGERSFVVRRKDDVQMVWAAYKVPSALHPHSDALGLAGKMLGDTPTGRLHKALVESGKATAVFNFELTGYAPGLQVFGATVKKGKPVEPVREALLQAIEGFSRTLPAAQELDRVKINVRNQLDEMFNDHESIGLALSEYVALGDWRLFFKARENLAKVTADEVMNAARQYFRRDNRTVGIYLPEDSPQRAEIPPAPALADVMKDFTVTTPLSKAEVFDPSPANIDARTQRFTIGGVKVALLPKRNRGETVTVSIRLNYGDEKSLFGKQAIRQLTAAMIGRGTSRMTRTQLSDAHDKYRMTGDFWNFQTTGPNLANALRLSSHAIRAAAFPASEFEQLKKETITHLEAQRNEPAARAGEAMARHFNLYPKGDPRYAASLDEQLADLKAVTLEQVKLFHSEFYGASSGQIAIVGDFESAPAKVVLQEEFGRWKSRRPYARIYWQYADIPAAQLQVATPDKENAYLSARINLPLKDDAPDFAAMLVVNNVMGGGFLSSRLMERLRQRDGLSYGTQTRLQVSAYDNAGYWSIMAIAAPHNMAKAEAAIREEVARALQDGFSATETASAIDNLLQLRMQNRAQDAVVASAWNDYLELGRSFVSWSERIDQQIKAVTPESALAALRKYVQVDKISFAIAADPAKR
ncbi:MAG: pitrilysin family protein [Proteobacteria bacterium]|nr:pitrilysin family protein [Pseudomonadota bacterium]